MSNAADTFPNVRTERGFGAADACSTHLWSVRRESLRGMLLHPRLGPASGRHARVNRALAEWGWLRRWPAGGPELQRSRLAGAERLTRAGFTVTPPQGPSQAQREDTQRAFDRLADQTLAMLLTLDTWPVLAEPDASSETIATVEPAPLVRADWPPPAHPLTSTPSRAPRSPRAPAGAGAHLAA